LFHVKRDLTAAHVSRETDARLRTFVDLLLNWNQRINLIAASDEAIVWERHVADSLSLLPLLPAGFAHGIDIGSGGGFPGLVLAIAADRPFHLVESDQRKAAFLREAARAVEAPAVVHAERVERVRIDPAPLITARAVAALPILLRWSARLLAPGGVCIFPKGRNVEGELTAAVAEWNMRVERLPSPTDSSATILRISQISASRPHES
jgi:16S rRNA (guanine527-N7)-methyltransferase